MKLIKINLQLFAGETVELALQTGENTAAIEAVEENQEELEQQQEQLEQKQEYLEKWQQWQQDDINSIYSRISALENPAEEIKEEAEEAKEEAEEAEESSEEDNTTIEGGSNESVSRETDNTNPILKILLGLVIAAMLFFGVKQFETKDE